MSKSIFNFKPKEKYDLILLELKQLVADINYKIIQVIKLPPYNIASCK